MSIALAHRGQVTQGVIYDPVPQRSLHRDPRARRVPQRPAHPRLASAQHLRDCLVGTGFPFRDGSYLDTYLKMMKAMIEQTAGLRRPGAAALDLAYVAAGFYDGFWEVGLNPWDVAAGSLLIQEAGGLIGDLAGDGDFLHGGQVIAANAQDLRADGDGARAVSRGHRARARAKSRRSRRMSGAGWVWSFSHTPRAPGPRFVACRRHSATMAVPGGAHSRDLMPLASSLLAPTRHTTQREFS